MMLIMLADDITGYWSQCNVDCHTHGDTMVIGHDQSNDDVIVMWCAAAAPC